MKHSLFILLLFILNSSLFYGQKNLVPENYKILDEINGDLDTDGVHEKVIVYDMTTTEIDNEGIDREIVIFKKDSLNNWIIWQRSVKATGNSREGGMMGDPYEGIEIKKGVLVISESGGSSWKWGHTDKYRFQNNSFELIGYSSHYGRICDYWGAFDFTISTQKIVFKKEFEKCEGDDDQTIYKTQNETFRYKLTEKILLQNRKEIEVKITTPKYKEEIYL
ncbi:hypothetical protein [Flavobacterium sp.]|uniref:hypothetical protein n=1 Tax=Flavobacterium sp. TaxID=239 RepID=UPI00248A6D8D|nr:hypothetical protein [Flavobacterium sp.]MDI1316120.1 hypothetical protein [Flavobacterium sp.]